MGEKTKKVIREVLIWVMVCFTSLTLVSCQARKPDRIDSTQRILDRLRKTSVVIKTLSGLCSGNIIHKRDQEMLVLTAAHCFRSDLIAIITDYKHVERVGYLKDIDVFNDIALVSVMGKDTSLPTLRISSNSLIIYERVYMVGHPKGLRWMPSVGYFSGIKTFLLTNGRLFRYRNFYKFWLEADFGNSGSAIVNSNMEVVSILTNGSLSNKVYTFGPTLGAIREFLSKHGM